MLNRVLCSGSSRFQPFLSYVSHAWCASSLLGYAYSNRDRAGVEVAIDGVGHMAE